MEAVAVALSALALVGVVVVWLELKAQKWVRDRDMHYVEFWLRSQEERKADKPITAQDPCRECGAMCTHVGDARNADLFTDDLQTCYLVCHECLSKIQGE